ncbi:TRAP transporter large permease [Sporosarcina newyorkensis]|uniref:C4-dicarboxylate transporter, DctM subunit n=1 Tax=Sporosarcina newyorkensis TaxID=759851 RepID=A0A1T4YUZ7_9BACL|nr:TRAP transporter large permease [Sporosarcina newyorkensis]SKB05526.1 C4-dicarboxylate transporter, DctM subunit [Sporosarcina newyorkensis]
MTIFLLFGSFILFLCLSVPIAIAIGLASTVTILAVQPVSMEAFTQTMMQSLNSFPLMAVPLFTFAGDIMGKGGISRRLLNVSSVFFGRLTGGLGVISIVTCLFFAAISGTGSATVAAIGLIMIPAMVARNYNKTFAASLVATAGTVGVLIPPSIPMIIYAVAAGVSVTGMFSAGVGPGVLVGLALIIYVLYYARKNDYKGDERKYSLKEALGIFINAIPALLIPVIILGGIYGGVFTPTEAAAIACFYGIIVSVFLYKEVKIKDLPYIAFRACLLCAPVIIIIGISSGFGLILTITEVPTVIADFILGISANKIVILLLINILLLIVGTFMETNAAIIILTPILLPIVTALGVNPIHFGLIMILNLAIGFITPPLGANLFMAAQISNTKFELLMKAIIPWIIVMIIVLLLVTYIPAISLFLPKLLNIPV